MAKNARVTGPPRDQRGYRPLPLALADQMSVCERCWSVVIRFHEEQHDAWHAALAEATASAAMTGPGCTHGPFA